MASYIHQLRRGTLEEWKTVNSHIIPLEGELVLEMDKSGNGLHRLRIGDGVHSFLDLPYMSVDSFILPQPSFIIMYADRWESTDDENRWRQQVVVANAVITSSSKIDLQPDAEQLSIFHAKDLAFVAENDNGKVYVYCIGQKPQNDYQIQVTVTEVVLNG